MFPSWVRLSIITTALVLLLTGLTMVSVALLDHYVQKRTETTALQVAKNIDLWIMDHVRALEVLADVEINSASPPSPGGTRMIASLVHRYPGFYAINWLNADGTIARVYPEEKNKNALGKNLYSVDTIAPSLERSRKNLIPVMVPRVRTFQGFDGATFYIPVVRDKKLIGWVNAVLDVQSLMESYLSSHTEEGLSVVLQWSNNKDRIYRFGPASDSDVSQVMETSIMGEDLRIGVRLNEVRDLQGRRWIGWALLATGLVLVGLFVHLVRELRLNIIELTLVNQRLAVKTALVSSLTHDMGTPLTTLLMLTDRFESHPEERDSLWERFKKTIFVLRSMMDSVRFLHAVEMGRASLTLKSVSLAEAVKEALELVHSQIERKNIVVRNQVTDPDLWVKADEATLSQNVIPNLLSNALKFSEDGGEIVLRAHRKNDAAVFEIADQGQGIPEHALKDFFDKGKILSRVGTRGELGSGLGMLQVKTFMDLYQGKVRIRSSAGEGRQGIGTTVTLVFAVGSRGENEKE